ncbi:MAG: alpha/beta fold hydrolase [Halioglobus sp.]|nr:alpha/beta fold hydrolase [Halioglobus sp.]
MTADLHVKRGGDGPAVVLLHGLFGSGSNLGALARALQARYTVYSVDLPNHGRSGWLTSPSLPAMAETVAQWMDGEGVPAAHFVGHSLGGKVAMELALQSPQRASSLTVADIAPVAYASHHGAIFAALDAVAGQPCRSREDAAARMATHIPEDGVIQFLLTSLQRDNEGGYQWRFDVTGLRASLPKLLQAPAAGRVYDGPVLFIKGGASDYLQEQYWPAIQAFFPAATMRIMPECGHWLHAEKPQLFNGIVSRYLESAEQRKLGVSDNIEDER